MIFRRGFASHEKLNAKLHIQKIFININYIMKLKFLLRNSGNDWFARISQPIAVSAGQQSDDRCAVAHEKCGERAERRI